MSIGDQEYVSLTTYKADGTPKPLPVWIVDLGDNTVGFTTHGESWKVKRIRNNPKVTLQPSDQRGNIVEGSNIVEGTARMGNDHEFERVSSLVKTKYGKWVTAVKIMNSLRSALGKGGQSDSAMIIELANAE